MSRKSQATSSKQYSSSSSYASSQESSKVSSTRSPLSPTRFSRMAEKAEMQNLNDRLAVYMDTVRSLEQENSRLVKQVEISQETITKEKTAVRNMYEQELADARKVLDDTANDRARLEIEIKRCKEENEDLKSSLDKTTRECQKMEASLNLLEHRYADLQTKYNKAVTDLKKHEEDLKELDKVKKALEQQKKYVENETLARVALENKLLSIKEESNFNKQIYEREVTELRTKRHQEISEIDGRLTTEYEGKLQAALNDLREQYEQQQQVYREEIINLYEAKLDDLQKANAKYINHATGAQEELRNSQSRFESVRQQLSTLESTNANLNARILDLERQLEQERNRNVEVISAMEQELNRTRDKMTSQLKDYQDLMDIKIALDYEISTYRKLLEIEEHRLNITPAAVNTPRRGTPQRRGTPLATKAAKRRRVIAEETERADYFQVTGEANGDIEISDVDPEGKFIQLFNKSNKEVAIGGWTIKHEAKGESSSFKLHRSVKIEAEGNVTVWSADAGHAHEPPHHIVQKQKWIVGDPSLTTLTNPDGEEVANRKRQRVQASSFRQEYGDDTDGTDPKKECAIM